MKKKEKMLKGNSIKQKLGLLQQNLLIVLLALFVMAMPVSAVEESTDDSMQHIPVRPSVEVPTDILNNLFYESQVLQLNNLRVDASNSNRYDLTEYLPLLQSLENATVHIEFRLDRNSDFKSIFSVSSTATGDNYFTLYSNGGSIGIEAKNGNDKFYNLPNNVPNNLVADTWNSITFVFNSTDASRDKLTVFINGVKAYGDNKSAKFIKDLLRVDRVQLGATPRGNQMKWGAAFSVNNFTVYNRALTAEEIGTRNEIFTRTNYSEILTATMEATDSQRVFVSGQNNRRAADGIFGYRIPAMIKTKNGTLIASADARETHSADWGNIGITIRRSTDNGDNWSERINPINLRDNPNPANRSQQSPVTIDSVLVQDPSSNKIFLIYDMFLEGQAIHSLPATYEAPYTTIDGHRYRTIYKTGASNVYTLRDDNYIYTDTGEKTEFKVVTSSTLPAKSNLGDVYREGAENTPIGNIYFTTNKTCDFRAAKDSYLWMQVSEDEGLTWSDPVDLTYMVSNEHIKFHGVGPGAGIVLQHGSHPGRIIVPTYTTNRHSSNHLNTQSSRVIYSDDHGVTWHRGKSPNDRTAEDGTVDDYSLQANSLSLLTESTVVELNDGTLKLFMRNQSGRVKVATSNNGGESWHGLTQVAAAPDVYVQLSALHLNYENKEYVLLANANGGGRNNGYVRVAEVKEGNVLEWISQKPIQSGDFAYNSLADLGEGKVGLLYEHSDAGYNAYSLHYRRFNMEYLLASTQPSVQVESVEKLDDYHFLMVFDKAVWANPGQNIKFNDDSGEAYFVAQADAKSLIYALNDKADWGKVLKTTKPTGILNLNNLKITISGQLPTADTANRNDFDIKRYVNDLRAKRIGRSQAKLEFVPWSDADYYIVTRTDLNTEETVNFEVPKSKFIDATIQKDHSYQYVVQAVVADTISLPSKSALVKAQAAQIDDRDESITYGKAFGNWDDRALFGGTEKYADITGNTTLTEADYTAKVEFVGTGIEIYGLKHSRLSTAKIKIDGVEQPAIDFYQASGTAKQVLIGSFTGLSATAHTLELIVNDGAVTRSQETNKISLDSFKIIDDESVAEVIPEVTLVKEKMIVATDLLQNMVTDIYRVYNITEDGAVVASNEEISVQLAKPGEVVRVAVEDGQFGKKLIAYDIGTKSLRFNMLPQGRFYITYTKAENIDATSQTENPSGVDVGVGTDTAPAENEETGNVTTQPEVDKAEPDNTPEALPDRTENNAGDSSAVDSGSEAIVDAEVSLGETTDYSELTGPTNLDSADTVSEEAIVAASSRGNLQVTPPVEGVAETGNPQLKAVDGANVKVGETKSTDVAETPKEGETATPKAIPIQGNSNSNSNRKTYLDEPNIIVDSTQGNDIVYKDITAESDNLNQAMVATQFEPSDGETVKLYEISMYKENTKVQPDKPVILTFVVPLDTKTAEIYHMVDGKLYEKYEGEAENGKVSIEVNHFSKFLVVAKPGASNNILSFALIAIIMLLIIGLGSLVVYGSKKRRR